MQRIDFSKVGFDMVQNFKRHCPGILTGVGIAGMLTTVIFTIRGTSTAVRLIDRKKKVNKVDKLGGKETFKTVWKCYIPSAVTFGLSTACLITANSENGKRNAALATAYSLSESALKEYREKVVEVVGEKKEKEIRDDVIKDKVDQSNFSPSEVIVTGNGDTLCVDGISGRAFKSSIEKLERAANILNRRMLNEMYVSLNDFYYEIGLKPSDIGDRLGWRIDRGFIELYFSAQLKDGTPYIYVKYSLEPQYDYQD